MNQSRPWQISLHVSTLFLAALLLFGLQPMVVRMILPALGGSPAVWTTAQVFFQALLLAGYIYAHLLSRMQSVGKTLLIHFVVLALALLLVPIALSETWQPKVDESPIVALLAMLALTVGPPYLCDRDHSTVDAALVFAQRQRPGIESLFSLTCRTGIWISCRLPPPPRSVLT